VKSLGFETKVKIILGQQKPSEKLFFTLHDAVGERLRAAKYPKATRVLKGIL